MKKRVYHIPVFVPHSGCPHDCAFCNQRRITGVSTQKTAYDVKRIIDEYLTTINKSKIEQRYTEVAFFGGSFTGIDVNIQKSLLSVAKYYKDNGFIDAIRCSTRPDYINDDILVMLKNMGMDIIELGVQSTDNDVLSANNRGHTKEDVYNAVSLIKKHGIRYGLQMMTGLYKDTYQKSLKTAYDLAKLNPECVRIYPTLVMEGTKLYDLYNKGLYVPFDVEQTVDLCCEIVKIFEKNNINIIRIGLQTTDGVNKNTVKGPYHEAITELIYGRLYRNAIENYICDNFNAKGKKIRIAVNPSCVSYASGHKKCNKIYFENKYNVLLNIKPDGGIDRSFIKIEDKTVNLF